eukprot:scaffold43189_cov35-Phaeocystis_antarctica.AAC.1
MGRRPGGVPGRPSGHGATARRDARAALWAPEQSYGRSGPAVPQPKPGPGPHPNPNPNLTIPTPTLTAPSQPLP